ncbi:MAG: hypothetical protein ACRD0C_08585 [Acidimicrobiia bacterium]
MAPNGFPGGQALLFLLPLIIIAAAVCVLTIAVRDQGGRPKHNLPRLPDPSSHPLHHVRVSMASTRRKAKVAARRAAQQQAEPAEPRPPSEPGETGGTGEVRPFRKRA